MSKIDEIAPNLKILEIIATTYSITKNETELANLKKLENLKVFCNYRGVTGLLNGLWKNRIPIKELTLLRILDINGFKERHAPYVQNIVCGVKDTCNMKIESP